MYAGNVFYARSSKLVCTSFFTRFYLMNSDSGLIQYDSNYCVSMRHFCAFLISFSKLRPQMQPPDHIR